MITLGLSGLRNHDPSAATVADGEPVVAAEEARFVRDKHAKGWFPVAPARFSLDVARVKPAAGYVGTVLGAVSCVATQEGDTVSKMEHVYLGPSCTAGQCRAACEARQSGPRWQGSENAAVKSAELLAAATRWPGSGGVWSLVRTRREIAASWLTRTIEVWRIALTRKSSTVNTGIGFARVCRTVLLLISSGRITRCLA